MNKWSSLYFFLLILCLLIISLTIFSYSDNPDSNHETIPQKIINVRWNKDLKFADEIIPLDNPDVAERLERELIINTYQHTSTLMHLKLAGRYLPTVEKIFHKEGIPDDLKYLAVAESSLRNAISSAGAKGIWQFRDAAAKDLGLIINEYVDERNNFEKSTYAACKYLKQLKARFNSWSLACAAYNMGPSALASTLKEQEENNYYNLNLSDETNRYVFRIIAIKEIMKSPDIYGYYLKSSESYRPFNTFTEISIDSSIHNLAKFAHEQGLSYRQLKVYNPWLMKSSLINKDKTVYKIKIPVQ